MEQQGELQVAEILGLTRWAPEAYYFRGFIPSYTHLQPWLNRVCWGYNYLITRGAPSCKGLLDVLVPMYPMGNPYIRRV